MTNNIDTTIRKLINLRDDMHESRHIRFADRVQECIMEIRSYHLNRDVYKYFISYRFYFGPDGVPCDYGNTVIDCPKPIMTTDDIISIEDRLRGRNRVVILNIVLIN